MTEATNTTRGPLTQEEILALSLRARTDADACDELATALVIETLARVKAERRVESLSGRVERLEHRLAVLLQKMFGRSSEKIDPAQLQLFLDDAPTNVADPEDDEPRERVSFMRRPKGHGRNTWPDHLAREEIRLDPDPKDLRCPCGKDLCRIREEITERGHFVPGYWAIRRYIRGVWACKDGCGGVVTAGLPPALVDKSKLEPSVAVTAAVGKFADHLPLERQSQMHARLGVDVAPTTLGDHVAALADLHEPTVAQMESEVLSEAHIHVDDTPVVVLLDAPKPGAGTEPPAKTQKKNRKLARVWTYVSLDGKVFYRFTEDRSRDMKGGPAEVLSRFKGTLIGDEYAGYDKISTRPGMTQAGCWAHCRRKFKDALGEDKKRASIFILMIGALFRLESAVRKRNESGTKATVDLPRLLALRQRWSKKRAEKIFAHAESIRHEVLPKSGLGSAIGYLLNNRAHLEAFLNDPLVPPDNNAAERALRGIAVGRKNYLHFGSMAGGDTAAVLYSLMGSCKALGVNPYAYLMDTTTTLLNNRDAPRCDLTPWAWAAAQAKRVASEALRAVAALDPP